MTGPVQQVLRAMLEDAAIPRYGLQISKHAGLETGTLYPVMARLERVGWVESSWEDPDLSITDGRPQRRYYQLTKNGARFQRYRKRLVRPSPSVSSMCSAVHPIMRESPCLAPGSTT